MLERMSTLLFGNWYSDYGFVNAFTYGKGYSSSSLCAGSDVTRRRSLFFITGISRPQLQTAAVHSVKRILTNSFARTGRSNLESVVARLSQSPDGVDIA